VISESWLCEGMKDRYNPTTGEVDFESANAFRGDFEHKLGRFGEQRGTPQGMNVGAVMTCCAKLQSFGLVLQVRQNPGKTFALLPYSPLKRGCDLLEYVARGGSATAS